MEATPVNRVTVCRKARFNAAHRLHNPKWDAERNRAVFGLCNNPNYHGHNYELIVRVTGEIDPETGYVVDMKELKTLINELVLEPFDHKNLNLDVTHFQDLNPTAENIAVIIWGLLRKSLDPRFDLSVTLYETEQNFVEFSGK